MPTLITQTLLGAWTYALDAREEVQEEAYQSFLDTLHKLPKETTPEMQNGIDFEGEVYKAAWGKDREPHPQWEEGIRKVSKILYRAPTQIRLSRPLTADGEELLLYGVLDSMKAGSIYDVKFLNKSFGSADLAGKYLHSPQHPAYLYLAPEALDFTYLVSDGQDLYTERYTRRMTRPIQDIATEFIRFLRVSGLMDVYREKWKAR
jgi:hypothetical protein